jgi:hypothetical protein
MRDAKDISKYCWLYRRRALTGLRLCNTPVDFGEELAALGLAGTTLLPLSLCVPILCSIVVPYQFNFVFVPGRALDIPRLPCVRVVVLFCFSSIPRLGLPGWA